ncbi:hypothetical protein [Viridibacillus arvi]|uniref:hypothetical protein n=1 Tax=Viridibacillus arvi TaxID=263475 RepID=UPI0034CF3FD8
MKQTIACVSDVYGILEKSNIQLSNKQKEAVVQTLYPHIEYSRMEAYKLGKQSCEANNTKY